MGAKKSIEKRKQKIRDRFVPMHDKLISDEPQELITRVVDYVYHCTDSASVLTATGMAMAVGLLRKTFLDFNEDSHEDPEVVAIVTTARILVEEQLERRLEGRSANGAAFNLKANFGWRDVTKLSLGAGENGDDPIKTNTSVDTSKFSTDLLKELIGHRNGGSSGTD